MAFVGPNTQFKITLRTFKQALLSLGYTPRQVYDRAVKFKLRKHLFVFTVTALTTATTAGSQYTSNGQTFTLQQSAPVGATSMMFSCEIGQPTAPASTLTYVASSSGALGTHQASIAYSALITPPACLGPFFNLQQPIPPL